MSIAVHRFDNEKRRRPEHHDRQAMLTPAYVLEPIRKLLSGSIGLDPCTEPDNPTRAERPQIDARLHEPCSASVPQGVWRDAPQPCESADSAPAPTELLDGLAFPMDYCSHSGAAPHSAIHLFPSLEMCGDPSPEAGWRLALG
jgi:hypothetical protein